MNELSLNVLDLANNCIAAGAGLVTITVVEDYEKNLLTISIEDDGCGMDEETLKKVIDPFYTTRTTRSVGLGVPLFKMAAQLCDGDVSISSQKGKGTLTTGTFTLNHIDRMPLGDMCATYCTLVSLNTNMDFVYTHTVNDKSFTADTREFKAVLEGIPIESTEVMTFIKDYITENTLEIKAAN